MAENLDWFNRVFTQLEDDSTFEVDGGYRLYEVLNDSVIFKKDIGHKHPIIELYDLDEAFTIAHICFDPYNQEFYLQFDEEELGGKVHLIFDSFDDIKGFFIGAWNKIISHEDEEELEEYDFFDEEHESEDFLDNDYGNLDPENKIYNHLTAMFLQHNNNVDMDKDKFKNIEWLDEEAIFNK